MNVLRQSLPPSALTPEAFTVPGLRHGAAAVSDREHGPALTEQPWHQQLARCIAMNMAPKDAATFCDCHVNMVYRLLRTPWFCERVEQFMTELNSDSFSLLRSAELGAVSTLIEITMDSKVSPSIRLAGANSIIDRVRGKATQHVEVKTETTPADPVAARDALLKEVESLRESRTLGLAARAEGAAGAAPSHSPPQTL